MTAGRDTFLSFVVLWVRALPLGVCACVYAGMKLYLSLNKYLLPLFSNYICALVFVSSAPGEQQYRNRIPSALCQDPLALFFILLGWNSALQHDPGVRNDWVRRKLSVRPFILQNYLPFSYRKYHKFLTINRVLRSKKNITNENLS